MSGGVVSRYMGLLDATAPAMGRGLAFYAETIVGQPLVNHRDLIESTVKWRARPRKRLERRSNCLSCVGSKLFVVYACACM